MSSHHAFDREGGKTPANVLTAIKVDLVRSSGEAATIRVSSPQHGASEEVSMTKIEGRWVPTNLAPGWGMATGQARAAIDKLPSMTEGPMKAMVKAELARFDQHLDAMEKATTAKAFMSALQGGRRQTPARPR